MPSNLPLQLTGDCVSLHLRDVLRVHLKIRVLQFDCCGTNNATEWMSPKVNMSGIPMSCCYDVVGAVGTSNCTVESPNLHRIGCIDAFANFAEEHAAKIAGVGIGLGIIQVSSSVLP